MDERIDDLTGRRSVIVGSRQSRPNLPSQGCPFCPGGLEAPDAYDVRWFVNRWPAMPDERCELVLYTPEHDAEFWTLGAAGALRVVELWTERTRVLGARGDVDYVLVFENRGPQVGATIAHPHGQIYAYEDVPPEPLAELDRGAAGAAGVDPTGVAPDLVVHRDGAWVAWVPEAATWPYELRLAHLGEVGALTDDDCDRQGLASTMVQVLARLDQLFDAPMPYMMWIHQRPTDGRAWPSARLHVHITPLNRGPGVQRFMAAAELGAGLFFNPVDPRDAAAALRAQPGVPT